MYDPDFTMEWQGFYSCGSDDECCWTEEGFATKEEAIAWLKEMVFPGSVHSGRISQKGTDFSIDAYSTEEKEALHAA